MRFLLSLILVLGLSTMAFAEVKGTVVGKLIDENGNIVIQTAYYKDGINVESRYPQMNVKDKDGKDVATYYWQTRYTVQNFADMSQEEQEARILQDVSQFAQSLITKDYITKANADLMQGQMLMGIVGKSVTEATAKIQVSPTKEWVVDTLGAKTEVAITPKVEEPIV
jgi:hypothetical protein